MMNAQKSRCGLAYFRLGQGHPLLLLHGIPGSGATWLKVAKELTADFDVVVPDLLGFGGSDRPIDFDSPNATAQADTLSRFLDELGIRSIALAGHDFGGPVALLLHAQRPETVSHLALFATNTFTDTPVPFPLSLATWPWLGKLAGSLLFSRASLRAMLWLGTGSPRVTLESDSYLGDADQVSAIGKIFAGSLSRLCELYAPVEAQLARVTVPRVVGWAANDPFFSVAQGQRTARALGVPLRMYGQAGHFLPEERPLEIAADLRMLLEDARNVAPRDEARELAGRIV